MHKQTGKGLFDFASSTINNSKTTDDKIKKIVSQVDVFLRLLQIKLTKVGETHPFFLKYGIKNVINTHWRDSDFKKKFNQTLSESIETNNNINVNNNSFDKIKNNNATLYTLNKMIYLSILVMKAIQKNSNEKLQDYIDFLTEMHFQNSAKVLFTKLNVSNIKRQQVNRKNINSNRKPNAIPKNRLPLGEGENFTRTPQRSNTVIPKNRLPLGEGENFTRKPKLSNTVTPNRKPKQTVLKPYKPRLNNRVEQNY